MIVPYEGLHPIDIYLSRHYYNYILRTLALSTFKLAEQNKYLMKTLTSSISHSTKYKVASNEDPHLVCVSCGPGFYIILQGPSSWWYTARLSMI